MAWVATTGGAKMVKCRRKCATRSVPTAPIVRLGHDLTFAQLATEEEVLLCFGVSTTILRPSTYDLLQVVVNTRRSW